MTQTILSAGRVQPQQTSAQTRSPSPLAPEQNLPTDEASSDLSVASSPRESDRVAKMKDVASNFEAIFVRKMLEQGSKTAMAQSEGLGGEFYQSMYHGQVADLASQSKRGFGIAKALLDSWGVKETTSSDPSHDLLRAQLEANAPAEDDG